MKTYSVCSRHPSCPREQSNRACDTSLRKYVINLEIKATAPLKMPTIPKITANAVPVCQTADSGRLRSVIDCVQIFNARRYSCLTSYACMDM
jgi:hypothetical protein